MPGEAHHRSMSKRIEEARPRLLRLAHLNGVGADEAEDVVQETLLEAWRHLEKLREPERFASWLDGICRNVCKRHLHARSITPLARELEVAKDGEPAFDLPDPQAVDPLEELERQDMHILLDRALSHLPVGTRELVELCYLAEVPQREAAERLRISLGALEVKLHRARHQLYQILHGEDLRADAQAFGLLLDGDEAAGWQETRQWCFLCGKHHLRGLFERQTSNRTSIRLRCPECSSRYETDLLNTAHHPEAGPIRSFRPVVKRIIQASAEFFHACLSQRRCPICLSSVATQVIDRRVLTPPYSHYDALPLGIYGRIDCPTCGPSFCEAYIPAFLHPTVRDFMLRPHIFYEPAVFVSYEGSDAIRFRLIDLNSTETLTVLTHPQMLHILAAMRK